MAQLIVVCVAGGGAVFCVFQFCDLMRRRDDEFPGRYDKPIWAIAILLGNVLGEFAY